MNLDTKRTEVNKPGLNSEVYFFERENRVFHAREPLI